MASLSLTVAVHLSDHPLDPDHSPATFAERGRLEHLRHRAALAPGCEGGVPLAQAERRSFLERLCQLERPLDSLRDETRRLKEEGHAVGSGNTPRVFVAALTTVLLGKQRREDASILGGNPPHPNVWPSEHLEAFLGGNRSPRPPSSTRHPGSSPGRSDRPPSPGPAGQHSPTTYSATYAPEGPTGSSADPGVRPLQGVRTGDYYLLRDGAGARRPSVKVVRLAALRTTETRLPSDTTH